jgi:hypothetical protein
LEAGAGRYRQKTRPTEVGAINETLAAGFEYSGVSSACRGGASFEALYSFGVEGLSLR